MIMVSPREVLDMQGDLAERLETPRLPLSGLLQRVSSLNFGKNNKISENTFAYVLTGRAYRIAANMNPEICARAWPQHEEDVPLLPEDDLYAQHPPPRHRGFAVFEEPLWLYLLSADTPSVVHAMAWGFGIHDNGERGWLVTFWSDISRQIDDVMFSIMTAQTGPKPVQRKMNKHRQDQIENYAATYGRWAPTAAYFIPKNEVTRVGSPVVEASFIDMNDVATVDHDPVLSPFRIIAAIWQLLSEQRECPEQTEPEQVPGYRGKALGPARARIRPEVNVVVLRRPSRPTINPGSGKKRTYRTWVEGGFERTYWVGPKGNQHPERRRIGGYWSVGDESLPIKNRPTVHDLRR